MRSAYETPDEPCPYCGEMCPADFCDVGVGMVQVGPYVCLNCGASESSPYNDDAFKRPDYDPKTGWYLPNSPLDDLANKDENGKPLGWKEADSKYRMSKGVSPRYNEEKPYG